VQVGCGVYLLTVRRRRYVYFWHYEARAGKSVQLKEYVGPADATRTRELAAARCEAYYRRAIEAIQRIRLQTLARISARS